MMKNKKLMFVFSMLSLYGLMIVMEELTRVNRDVEVALQTWFWCSLPLIIQLIYIAIFRDSSKSE